MVFQCCEDRCPLPHVGHALRPSRRFCSLHRKLQLLNRCVRTLGTQSESEEATGSGRRENESDQEHEEKAAEEGALPVDPNYLSGTSVAVLFGLFSLPLDGSDHLWLSQASEHEHGDGGLVLRMRSRRRSTISFAF